MQRLPGAIMEETQLAMFLTVQLTSQLLHDSSLGLEMNLIFFVVESQGQIACCCTVHLAGHITFLFRIFFNYSFSGTGRSVFGVQTRIRRGHENCRT